jgi:hypothetical protein
VARVGYFEGSDSLLLAKLSAEGIETVPISNAVDGHGRYVNHLRKGEVDVVVGYLHKVIPANRIHEKPSDILHACMIHKIPVILVAPGEVHDKARRLLGDVGPNVSVVGPDEVENQIKKHL